MVLRSCFPELPGGGCWPQEAGPAHRGCFPGHEARPVRQDRAPSNNGLLPRVAYVLEETAVVRLSAHVPRTKAGAAGDRVARGRSRSRYAAP